MSAPSTGRETADAPPRAATGPAAPEEHDWKRIAETPEFRALHSSRRRFTLIGMAIETAALIIGMALFGFAPDAMGEPAIGSITWALLVGTVLVVLTFVMALAYSHKAKQWEGMAAAALEHAGDRIEPTGRFAR
jgi:uncharacterized membrane protein (DUF485 family)